MTSMFVVILSEMAKEYAQFPVRMIAELLQFIILVAIIWVVAIGFGKRRGFVANMLSERMTRVRADLEQAQGAPATLEEATQAAKQREDAAAKEAERLAIEARDGTAKSREEARAEADIEAERIVERARAALVNERAQMESDLREQLVELVSQASRLIMNEKLTVAEQRSRIEEAITAGVATVDGTSG